MIATRGRAALTLVNRDDAARRRVERGNLRQIKAACGWWVTDLSFAGDQIMDEQLKRKVSSLLDSHRTMRIATLRPDGWPQTTTVGYANDGLNLYFLCGKESQKAHNLALDDRVSIAIDDDPAQVLEITGLSMAARARRVTAVAEGIKALKLLFARYPDQKGMSIPMPSPTDVAIFCVEPTVISVLDYSLGFGHTDLATCDVGNGRALA